jgi:hypothetical protein
LAYLHPNSQQCHNNNTPGAAAPGGIPGSGPTGCPEFEQMILNVFANGRNSVPSAAQTRILWINDGGIFNEGSLKADGVDWSVSYDADLGDLGAWNTGVVGTYYLHRTSSFPDQYSIPLAIRRLPSAARPRTISIRIWQMSVMLRRMV